MNNNFTERFATMLNGRKMYGWRLGLKISNGATEKLKKGVVPGHEIQNVIHKFERVNWRWLTQGEGQQYAVETFIDAVDYGDRVNEMMSDSAVSCYIVEFSQICTFVFTRIVNSEYKEKPITYKDVTVMTGPYSQELLNIINSNTQSQSVYQLELSKVERKAIRNGQLGNYDLFGDEETPGLLSDEGTFTRVYQLEIPSEPDDREMVDVQLMRAVLVLVDQTMTEQQVTLSADDKSKVISAVYSHAVRTKVKTTALNSASVLVALDAI